MKLTLVLFGITGTYLNIVFIRAEISYKKNRGTAERKRFEKRKEEKKRIERGEVRIILGESTDNEDY